MTELPVIDIDELRRVMEDYSERGWTDGLPVMPVTESYLTEFLSQTAREPDEVLLAMPHLDRECTIRTAAINAAMAGCLPEYFPVVLAAWSALQGLGPEHAELFAQHGWSKDDLRRAVYEHASNTREALAAVGKDAVSGQTRWRLSGDHPDAVPDSAAGSDRVRVLNSAQAVQIVVAGAHNSGVSAVIETFGPRGGPPAIVPIESPAA